MIIRDVTLPLRLVTLENQRMHWAMKAKLAKQQRWSAGMALRGREPYCDGSGDFRITLTRVGPRKLDPGNYHGCFKHVQDGVADWLGIDDGDPRLEWVYLQEQRKKTYAVHIVIERKEG